MLIYELGVSMRELIGFWLISMSINAAYILAGVEGDLKACIILFLQMGSVLAIALIGVYLMGG